MMRALFPYYEKLPEIIYSRVQQQLNFSDCAIFAMAFATSIFFKDNPEEITYDNENNKIREHLLNVLESNTMVNCYYIRASVSLTNNVYQEI